MRALVKSRLVRYIPGMFSTRKLRRDLAAGYDIVRGSTILAARIHLVQQQSRKRAA